MNTFLKWIIPLFVFTGTLFLGNETVFQAVPSSVKVAECLEKPDLCEPEQSQNSKDKEIKKAPSKVGIGFLDIVRMIAALFFVIGLLYFLLKFINRKSRSYQENNTVRHLGGTGLGGSRSIQVVKIGKRILVVGVGEDVSLLKEIDDPEEHNDILKRYEEQQEAFIQPVDFLNKAKTIWAQPKTNKSSDFNQELERKIKELKTSRKQAIQDLKNREQNQHE